MGFALVLVLAVVVLVTFTILAFFSRTTANRRIENASSSAAQANILAETASQIILSDLKTEIIGGSNTLQPTTDQMPIYQPLAPQKMLPSRVLSQTGMATDPSFNNLVKQSSGRIIPSGAGYTANPLILSSTTRDTTVPSSNKRIVSAIRWNAPVLNLGSGFTTADQLPQWILLDRQGIAPTQSWDNTFRDYTPGNDRAIIGRFAFNVYDVGGLLDTNTAGYPEYGLSATQIQQLKSTQAGATLDSILPDFDATRQTAFVNTWRFKSNSSGNFFTDFMSTSPTFADSGFMKPTVRSSVSNSLAYSRQDLIRATIASNAYLTTNSLPYFTHFSRELNAPSWSPVTPAGSSIDYGAQAEQPTAINRDILNTRVSVAFTRADGTQAIVGEPLMKYRFPLRRLDGIGYNGVNTSSGTYQVMKDGVLQLPTAATIQRDFGIVWNGSDNHWDYVGASGSSVQSNIRTLDQVASESREPNFFEILKAFILSGSVGVGSGSARTVADAEVRYYQLPLSADSQIIQIGANIIDQWDGDKNPTMVNFANNEIAGVENLPYLNKLIYQSQWSSATAFTAWLMPSFWIALQNGTSIGTQSATIPAVRFVMTSGQASGVVESSSSSASSAIVTAAAGTPPSPSLQLVKTADFFTTPITPSTSSSPNNGVTPPNAPNAKLGIPFTFTAAQLGTVTRTNTVRTYPVLDNATFEMQAQIGGTSGPWKTYQRWSNCKVNTPSVTSVCQPGPVIVGTQWGSASIYDPEYVLLDPRTMRFGVWETNGAQTLDTTDFNRGHNETLERATGGFQKITGMGPQGSNFNGVGPQMANNTATAPNYTDLDAIRRQGDTLSAGATSAMLPTNSSDRSSILSRPIRTVAELGTVFRDQPWKTINFTTPDSADSGLLDAFTIFEPNTVFRSDIVAGKLSLNTRQKLVLRAVLDGIATNTNTSTLLITTAQRDNIADALVAMTATPIANKSELVTRFAADPSVTALGNKEAREAVIRALADVGQTRTWNLMIDVIAQSGKYGAQASTVDNFVVKGEKRYWLHVAIDRFTGEVIDQQLEAVYE